ncbi:fimbria/pilus outer membrane usher protein [Marilutibacter chinensis]|uniref:Fimbria/pilus outer membrane usher protein n=1 Tax=Marilutibacter chinensis TaxID=2912247 RepID=A0ABS9HVD8_9GAMM|nr:fimbria/pilus outer membrane usher protein [Lysobacter chinensis]MCF7222653.1 fimbria/pilus outer membrane usher protein [Lysobacter chinensis]
MPKPGSALLLATALVPLATAAAAPPTVAENPPQAAAPPGDGEVLYLEVVLNHTRHPRLVRFLREGSRFAANAADLRRLGLALGDRTTGTIALDELSGIRFRYDVAGQRMVIDAPLTELDLPTTVIGISDDAPLPVTATSPGLLLNYDVHADRDDEGNTLLSTVGEVRLSGVAPGVFSTSAVNRLHRSSGGGWHSGTTRLDSHWELSFPEHAVTVRAGDVFSGFLDWTRPVRMGGVQIGRNFGLQPYRVTTPLPAFLGEVAVPSAVELYVNGMRQYGGQLPAGPFELNALPGVTGAGNATLVITDAFGRTRSLDFPFYSARQLLARGLSDWSLSIGTVRKDYGVESFSYAGELVASGNLRYGVADPFTLELHAEAGDGLVNAGIGAVWLIGRAGVLNASHARSRGAGHGSQSSLGYRWNNRHFNLSVDSQRSHGDYRDIASLYGPRPPSVSTRALAGITTETLGNIGITHVRLEHPDPEIASARYAGVFWTRSFARGWSANLSYNENLDDSRDRSIHLNVNVSLGDGRQFGTSWQRNHGRDAALLDFAKPVPGDGGFGWRLQARDGDDGSGGMAEAGWLHEHGRFGVGVARVGDLRHGYLQASGSVVLMAGRAFAARRIDDAFAIVSTDGVAGVPVRLENRLIGHTDADGMLLVARLNAWQRNRLSIDPMMLPIDVRIGDVERIATPGDRSGARVRFAITPVRAAVIVLHDTSGRPLPLRSRVYLEGRDTGAIVGHDGETYLEELAGHNRLSARTPSGTLCHASFLYPEAEDAIPRIGPLRCLQETAP